MSNFTNSIAATSHMKPNFVIIFQKLFEVICFIKIYLSQNFPWKQQQPKLVGKTFFLLYIYGIHYRRILWSSYRKLAWVGFEPTTTEFRSDALTDWTIKPWVQLALRANSVQLLQFRRLFSVTFHFGYCLRQSPRCFNRTFVEVITWV